MKFWKYQKKNNIFYVTPFTGVWIEIDKTLNCSCKTVLVTPFTGVWIEIAQQNIQYLKNHVSLPLWECGLKFVFLLHLNKLFQSLPLRECGLKYQFEPNLLDLLHCHSLYGSVDWNYDSYSMFEIPEDVTPFTGVWIEITRHQMKKKLLKSHSLRGSVDWNRFKWVIKHDNLCCHSLHGSVDWNSHLAPYNYSWKIVTPFTGGCGLK